MNLDRLGDDIFVVSLSRQNLEGLLDQLGDGAKDAQITRRTPSGLLIVHAQEDADHYVGRPSGSSS